MSLGLIYVRLVNLTPHAISILDGESKITYIIEASGRVARLVEQRQDAGILIIAEREGEEEQKNVPSIPFSTVGYGEVEGLPEPEEGTLYIVSLPLAQALRTSGRRDILVVGTAVRRGGEIIGALGLSMIV